ncbi:unnamed protein product [Malus baccata var. baccata]
MTSELANLNLATPFTGTDTITTAMAQFSSALKIFQSDGGGKLYVSRHVLFDEYTFPYTTLASKTHPLECVSNCTSSPLIPLLTENNTVISSPPSLSHTIHSSSSPASSTSLPPRASESFIEPSSASESLNVPFSASELFTTIHAPNTLSQGSTLFSPVSITATQSPIPDDPDFQSKNLTVVLPVLSVNLHPMQTWSKSGIVKRKAYSATVTSSENSIVKLTTYKAATKIPEWQAAMQDEITALHLQQTWDLVPLPSGKNLVGCKYKARLVAKGYSQEEGIDYSETFNPVVKPTTVRLIMALAAQFHWDLRQLDVKMRFCMVTYMKSTDHPSHYVCKLKKSLYGLKQAPCAWNEKFTSFLPGLDFQPSLADPSLFAKCTELGIVVLLLYVDDIIITGSSSSDISTVILALTQQFDMKDLGQLSYFLGLPIQLLKEEGQPYHNPEQYRSVVAALQYLTFTKPDIAFAVNQCCQFMHRPMDSHVVAVKRILRYLSGTMTYGIHFKPGTLFLQAYSDVDWAGDPNDRRSTSSYIVYLSTSLISWASRKQHIVSRSSTEAEYRALAITAAEMAWIRQLLCDLQAWQTCRVSRVRVVFV